MSDKSTPGPWKGSTINGVWAGSTMIADVVSNDADARLIAASPELLEAAKRLITGTAGPESLSYEQAWEKMREAIAKAQTL